MDKLTKEQIAKRIEKRFLKKQTGSIKIHVNKTVLRVEYMYGNKYNLMRKKNGVVSTLEMLHTLDKIAELIYKEQFEGTLYGKLRSLSK